MPVTRTSLAGAAVVAIWNRWRARRCDSADLLLHRALDGRAPRRAHDGGQRQHHQQDQHRIDGGEQHDRDPEAQDPAGGGEHREVQVVEHEGLVAEDREPVEVLGSLVVGDGRDRCLQVGDVGLERDRDLVAEAALHPGRHDAQEPREGDAGTEADGRHGDHGRVLVDDALGQHGEEHRQQGVGQGGEQGQPDRRRHELRLVLVAELAQAPHGRDRRRELVGRALGGGRGVR